MKRNDYLIANARSKAGAQNHLGDRNAATDGVFVTVCLTP